METNEKMLSPYELHEVEMMRDIARSSEALLNYALEAEKSGDYARARFYIANVINTVENAVVVSKKIFDSDIAKYF